MKLVLKILKVTGILLLILLALIAALLVLLSMKPFVPNNYTKTVDTGGGIEARYLSMGAHEVRYAEAGAPGDWKKFEAFYPAGLETEEGAYPVVVFANGTGVAAENDVISPDGVKELADAIPAGTVTALRPGMDHGRMLYSSDGYVTAWFMWQLQGDQDAAKAFVGESPELLGNTLYQDAAVSLE